MLNYSKINNFAVNFARGKYICFLNDDTEVIQQIVTQFIEISVQCCSDGFEIVTFNEENKLLALAIQALSENRMMQFNLQNSEGNE